MFFARDPAAIIGGVRESGKDCFFLKDFRASVKGKLNEISR
jgi:hypothetical protein